LALGDVKSAVWYVLCFCCIREYAGGYHASTRIGCTVIMIGVFILAFKLSFYLRSNDNSLLIIGLIFVIDVVIFILYAPMKTNRKRIEKEVIKRSKLAALVATSTYGIVALLFLDRRMFAFIVLVETAIAALIIICKPWRIKNDSENIRKDFENDL